MTTAADVLGTLSTDAQERLRREVKRQLRGAGNKLATTAGADDDAKLVGILTVTGDIVGYTPPAAP